MKTLFSTIGLLLISASRAFAHEEGTEMTDVAEADWVSPLIAILIIIGTIVIAWIIRTKSKTQIINK